MLVKGAPGVVVTALPCPNFCGNFLPSWGSLAWFPGLSNIYIYSWHDPKYMKLFEWIKCVTTDWEIKKTLVCSCNHHHTWFSQTHIATTAIAYISEPGYHFLWYQCVEVFWDLAWFPRSLWAKWYVSWTYNGMNESRRNFIENLSIFSGSNVLAYGQALLWARTSPRLYAKEV